MRERGRAKARRIGKEIGGVSKKWMDIKREEIEKKI